MTRRDGEGLGCCCCCCCWWRWQQRRRRWWWRRRQGGGGDRESEINDHGGRVRRQKCQSVFTEAHYSCFETHKLSPGEQITGATAAAAAAANKQRVLHGGLFIIIITFFFLTQDLALIHSHSSDVLTPKGPCPAVTEQLTPPPHPPHPAISLIALLAQRNKKEKKKEKDSVGGQLLSFHHIIVPPFQLKRH